MAKYLGIDPANELSGYVIIDENLKPIEFGKIPNDELLNRVYELKDELDYIAIEMIACYGMAVGKTVFETCVYIGRLLEAVKDCENVKLIYRKDEKMNFCGTMKSKDKDIRQALIKRFAKFDLKNGKGTKDNHDWFYGFKADVWQAYAVIITAYDKYIK